MKDVEFSITGEGSTIMIQEGKAPRVLTADDHETIKYFIHIIESRYPEAFNALKEEYGQYPDFRFRAVSRFIKCNWGNDDEIKDIDENGSFRFEHVRCPLRGGFCIWEDTVCHPKELNHLSSRELDVLKLYATGSSLKEVAQKLFISVRTVETHRDNIYSKLGVKNQSQLTDYAHKHLNNH
jgi:DNA-binding CsgD family transcriptional regulator